MKENKKILKIVRIVLFIVIICLIIFLLLTFCTPIGKAYRTIKYINSEKVKSDVIPLGNTSYWYSEYKGEIDSSIIDKSVYYFSTTLIPEYYNINNVEKYYEKHKREIKILLGITDYKSFNAIVEKIKELEGEKITFEKYSIVEKSTQNRENSLETVIGIQYENNEVILFTLEISNKPQKNKTPVIYKADLNKEYNVERDDTYIDKESHNEKSPGKVIN